MVEEMLAARGIIVSHESVRQWALKFGQAFANRIRRRLPASGDKWHLDEVAVKIAGKKHWLWRAVAPCCTDRRCGRTEPYPCSGLCDADVLRASQLQHAVQHVGHDGYLARLSPVRLRPQPLANDALPARHIRFHQGAPVVPRGLLPAHPTALGDAP